ncbi:MAG TPA: sigma-70 family RNA polymerase sigma factor [Terriglobales bacterium]|nr:sigma-70 family RNA polymerase sigma factor [Terriglobales bacterium]
MALQRGMLTGGDGDVVASTTALPSSPGFDLLTDAEIMLRVKAGDDSAFEHLVEKFRRPLVGFLYRMARNHAVAEELAQEVFLRVYRSRKTYRASAKFTTWMYRIAVNLAVNHARDSRNRRGEVSLDEPKEGGAAFEVADGELTAEQDLLRRERVRAIRSHVEALPERQRLAVVMHKYQGLDYRQIAQVLKLSESATKSMLFRAYETLRESLKEFL